MTASKNRHASEMVIALRLWILSPLKSTASAMGFRRFPLQSGHTTDSPQAPIRFILDHFHERRTIGSTPAQVTLTLAWPAAVISGTLSSVGHVGTEQEVRLGARR